MKNLSLLFVFLLSASLLQAQDTTWVRDTTGISLRCYSGVEAGIFESGEKLQLKSKGSVGEDCQPDERFQQAPAGKLLLVFPFSGFDCHSTFRFWYRLNEKEKLLEYRVGITYGGCRAGPMLKLRFALLPAVPADWKIKILSGETEKDQFEFTGEFDESYLISRD